MKINLITAIFALFISVSMAGPGEESLMQNKNKDVRIVAMGDLHGDYDAFIQILKKANLVDETKQWIGGDSVLVQTGDIVDRGPYAKNIWETLMILKKQAEQQGGKVIPLLGNHEIMNLIGASSENRNTFWRYVSWMDVNLFGSYGQREMALRKNGDLGKFLRNLNVVAKLGDNVFVHGGIEPEVAAFGIENINKAYEYFLLHDDMTPFIRSPFLDEKSANPIWSRFFSSPLNPESVICPKLEISLRHLGAKRMIVGHSIQDDGKIKTRCGGQLVLIDIAISRWANAQGKPNLDALEIIGDIMTSIFTGEAIK